MEFGGNKSYMGQDSARMRSVISYHGKGHAWTFVEEPRPLNKPSNKLTS